MNPINLYISNVPADAEWREELLAELTAGELWSGIRIEETSKRRVLPENGEGIDVFVPLLSEDYIYYLTNPFNIQRLQRLIKRADQRLTLFCPVVLRPCAWQRTDFKRFRLLPIPSMHAPLYAVSETEYWGDRSRAWKKVAADLKHYIDFMHEFKEQLHEAAAFNAQQSGNTEIEKEESYTEAEMEQISNVFPSSERYVYREKPLPEQGPLRIGFMSAQMLQPEGLYWENNPEWQALQGLSGLEWVPIESIEQRSLFEWIWNRGLQALHISAWGHPRPGSVELQFPPDPRTQNATAQILNQTLTFFSHQLDFAFFSGSFTEEIRLLTEQTLPHIVGVYGITPPSMGLQFAQLFYQSIAAGQSYTQAFERAKAAVHPRYVPKGRLPELLVRF